MFQLALLLLLFLLSLLVLFRAPTSLLWYLSILVTEFSWIFLGLTCLLLFLPWPAGLYSPACRITGTASMLLLLLPYWQASRAGRRLQSEWVQHFPAKATWGQAPFNMQKIFRGITAKKIAFVTLTYDSTHQLTLDFYPAPGKGKRPCVLVIHGGSWAGGNSRQLPELNSEMAKWSYHVACINYQLAPNAQFPAPVQNVKTALAYLEQQAAALSIDANRFVLLGRSAGGQIALTAAYTLSNNRVKGVVDFYGPTDMVWGYQHPTNPLVLDSRKVMEDYLGGTLGELSARYEESSATHSIKAGAPPTLMIYAEHDPLVSPRHGTRLEVSLKKFQVPFYSLYLPWATHGFDYTLNGPGGQLSTWAVKQFLEAILSEVNESVFKYR